MHLTRSASPILFAILCVPIISGCLAFRYAEYKAPALRLDGPSNEPLPDRDAASVNDALDAWGRDGESARYPTAYHRFVRTPAPGTFEGERLVGVAFSGGGTRGTVFAATCVQELLGSGDGGKILDEVDYVTGVSTGAIPAAVYVLNQNGNCPDHMRLAHWPDCFNQSITKKSFKGWAVRPWWIARDMLFGANTRPMASSAIANAFFDGRPHQLSSGLTFGDLPDTPVLLMGATIINDPGAPFIYTRMPYRYYLDERPETPWEVGIQSFETFHSNPMTYPLGEACYNSSSFPANMRSGLMRMHEPDPEWVYEALSADGAERMRRARSQPGYEGTYEIKDGGLVDNRGVAMLVWLFEKLQSEARRPALILSLDASGRPLIEATPGGRVLQKGWMNEWAASYLANWQTGQDAYERWAEIVEQSGPFTLVRIRFAAWAPFVSQCGEPAVEERIETAHLRELCAAEPLIGTPERLLDVARSMRTSFGALDDEQMAAIRISARFAIWDEREELMRWLANSSSGSEGGGS